MFLFNIHVVLAHAWLNRTPLRNNSVQYWSNIPLVKSFNWLIQTIVSNMRFQQTLLLIWNKVSSSLKSQLMYKKRKYFWVCSWIYIQVSRWEIPKAMLLVELKSKLVLLCNPFINSVTWKVRDLLVSCWENTFLITMDVHKHEAFRSQSIHTLFLLHNIIHQIYNAL